MGFEESVVIERARPDPATEQAVRTYLGRVSGMVEVDHAVLYGSRVRGDSRPDSDADLALILHGPKGDRFGVMDRVAGLAFDILLETGVLIQVVPIWQEEWEHPATFSNPRLLENIRREGIALQ